MAGDKRFTIPNLAPKEFYAIQVRSVDNGESSIWSRKFSFTTVDDAHSGGPNGGEITAPEATTLISWDVTEAGFVGVWNAISIMLDGKVTVISHYDLELFDATSGQTKIFKYYTNSKPLVQITFTLSMMQGIFGATPGAVTLRVRAVNQAGTESAWSNALTASMGIPDPPTNAVVVEAIDSINISWTAPVNTNYLHGYRVYVGTTAGFTPSPVNKIYEGAAPTMTYTTATYSLHYFKIRSYSSWGTESTDLTATGTPHSPFVIDVAPPSVPALSGALSTSSTLPRFADLTWTFNEFAVGNTDVAGFVIAWRKVGDTVWKQNFASKELRSLSIELPLPFADYEFKIASYDFTGNYSTYSTPVLSLGGSIPGAPAQVTGVTSTASLDSFRITWTANTEPDVTFGGHYDVDIATNSGFTTGLQSYSTGTNEIVIGSLLPGTTYYYRVRAVDVGGSAGTYSTTGSRLTPDYAPTKSDGAAPSTSPTPTLVSGIGYLTALWTRITNNDPVTYEVHISTSTGFTPSGATLVTETTATTTIIRTLADKTTPLTYGTTYYVKLIAKDADGAAAAGSQASASPAQAGNADVSDVSAGKLTAGSITSGTIVLGSGGIFRTNNSDVIITDTGITVGANSQISAAAMQAGTAFVDDLTISSNFTIGTSGVMKSANYVAGTTGWQLTNTAFDMRSGTIAAGTLVAGTITSGGIIIGANGAITVDSSGVIKSNNFAAGVTGWQISATGIQMNDANSQISAAAIKTSALGAVTVTIGSGGAIRSSNWNGTNAGFSISDTALTMYTGTIQGAAVYTNQIASLSTDPNSPLPPLPGNVQGPAFGINASGKAVFSGALIYGNTVVGASASNFIQSNNYVAGTSGWIIRGDGYAEIASLQVYGSAKVGGSLSSIAAGWLLNSDGSASFTNANMILGNAGSGSLWLLNVGGEGQFRIYPAGQTPGISSYFHYIRGEGNALAIRGASGGVVYLSDAYNIANVGWVNNVVYIGVHANVGNNLYVDNYLRVQGTADIVGATTFWNTLTVQNQTIVNGYLQGNSIAAVNGVSGAFVNTPELRGDPVHNWLVGGGLTGASIGNSGRLQRTVSSLRYKQNITPLEYTAEQILALTPHSFDWKDIENYGPRRDAGFIAEEADALGLTAFVTYGRDAQGASRPEGFQYQNYVSALQKVAQYQQGQIAALTARVEALEG